MGPFCADDIAVSAQDSHSALDPFSRDSLVLQAAQSQLKTAFSTPLPPLPMVSAQSRIPFSSDAQARSQGLVLAILSPTNHLMSLTSNHQSAKICKISSLPHPYALTATLGHHLPILQVSSGLASHPGASCSDGVIHLLHWMKPSKGRDWIFTFPPCA